MNRDIFPCRCYDPPSYCKAVVGGMKCDGSNGCSLYFADYEAAYARCKMWDILVKRVRNKRRKRK